MRSRDPADAPFLFDNPRPALSDERTEHPFESVLRFAYGYRDVIIANNAQINTMTADQWALGAGFARIRTLESSQSLGSHRQTALGAMRRKPLEAIATKFTGDETDPAIRRAGANHSPEPLGWKLAESIAFVNSRDHPAIQLAE